MRSQFIIIPALTALALTLPAHADGLTIPPINNPEVAKECSACHMLYPAGLLPARSWSRVMGDLKNHFGDNAELDPALTQRMTSYLTQNAAGAGRGSSKVIGDLAATETPLRITELPWWKRKHEKKDRVSPATLKRNNAKFKGDCLACHKQSEKGYFEDD